MLGFFVAAAIIGLADVSLLFSPGRSYPSDDPIRVQPLDLLQPPAV